jgi:hypothetical protein
VCGAADIKGTANTSLGAVVEQGAPPTPARGATTPAVGQTDSSHASSSAYKVHIEPDLETAHLRVVNAFNPFSGLQNATYTLKSSKVVSEETCMEYMQVRLPADALDVDCHTSQHTSPISILSPIQTVH